MQLISICYRFFKLPIVIKLVIILMLYSNCNISIAAEPATDKSKVENIDDQTPDGFSNTKKIDEKNLLRIKKINSLTQDLEKLKSDIKSSYKSSSLNTKNFNSMSESFTSIDKKIDNILLKFNKIKDLGKTNIDEIKKNKGELAKLLRSTRSTISDISLQKSLIEDNSIRLYEILVKIDTLSEILRKTSKDSKSLAKNIVDKQSQSDSNKNLNTLWMLISIILISLVPLAFVLSSDETKYHLLKDGTAHRQGIILVSLGVFLGYFLVGFGLMYGISAAGWIGISNYVLDSTSQLLNIPSKVPFFEMLLYQMGFSVLASLIIYTAIGRLLSATSHMVLSLFTGAILIPIFGHWVWAEQFIVENKGWLALLGFIDQSGATVIHIIPALFAFIIILKLSKANENIPIIGDFPVYSSSATLFLWVSWQGLTTGSLGIDNNQISFTMLNNGLAASSGGIMAFLHYVFFHSDKGKISRGLSGVVTGLVAISACSSSVTPIEAIAIGAVAGILQNLSFEFLHKYFLKQDSQIPAAYLISIHAIGGIWGTLCVALLGTEGSFSAPSNIQVIIQLQGILVAIMYSFIFGYIVASILKYQEKKHKYQEQNLSLTHD